MNYCNRNKHSPYCKVSKKFNDDDKIFFCWNSAEVWIVVYGKALAI